jgi:murein hydrolase activator
MWRSAAWAVVGALLCVGGTGTAIAQKQADACSAEAGDVTALIACLRSAYGRTDAAKPQDCEHRPPAFLAPVEGHRVLGFGARTTYGGTSKGTVVEGAPGAPVSAPAAGFALFAGEFRSYGTLVIIDAGCGTEVLLAGIIGLTIAAGGEVERGRPIGTMTSSPTPDDLPVVYFEVRKNDTPVDPEQ